MREKLSYNSPESVVVDLEPEVSMLTISGDYPPIPWSDEDDDE